MNIDINMVLVAVISATPPTVVALANLVASLRNGRKVDQIKAATDGMKDELVKVTRSDALQEGHTAGVKEQKAVEKGVKE